MISSNTNLSKALTVFLSLRDLGDIPGIAVLLHFSNGTEFGTVVRTAKFIPATSEIQAQLELRLDGGAKIVIVEKSNCYAISYYEEIESGWRQDLPRIHIGKARHVLCLAGSTRCCVTDSIFPAGYMLPPLPAKDRPWAIDNKADPGLNRPHPAHT